MTDAPAPRHPSGLPLVLGHRGAPPLAPENTLASFEAALRAGADGVELDLQLTADYVLVVRHDPDIDGRQVRSLTLDGFRALAPDSPTLTDALEFFDARPEAFVNLELKPGVPADGREAALARALESWSGANRGRLWVSTFDPHALSRLSRLKVGVPLALLAADEIHLDLLPCMPVVAVHPHHTLVTAERLERWREAGLVVHVWTVNDVSRAAELLKLGVDGLISDHPGTVARTRIR